MILASTGTLDGSVATQQRGILFHLGLSRPEVAEGSREAGTVAARESHRGRTVALRTGGPRELELALVLGPRLRHVWRAGQREQERREVVFLLLAQSQRNDSAIEERVLHAALVVMIERVPDSRLRAVVKYGCVT